MSKAVYDGDHVRLTTAGEGSGATLVITTKESTIIPFPVHVALTRAVVKSLLPDLLMWCGGMDWPTDELREEVINANVCEPA